MPQKELTKGNTNQVEVLPKLTRKQQVFLAEYTVSFNLTQAVQKAYPNMTYNAARAYGVKLKKSPSVAAHLEVIFQIIRDSVSPAYIIARYREKIERWNSSDDIKKDHLSLQALNGLARIVCKDDVPIVAPTQINVVCHY